jgi:hypothetical protein
MLAPVLADAVQGMVGAVIDAGDRRALRFKAIAHPSRQVRMSLFIEIVTADARLVADDNNLSPHFIRPEPRQFENSWNELELVNLVDLATVYVDHTVTVEKERAVTHNL